MPRVKEKRTFFQVIVIRLLQKLVGLLEDIMAGQPEVETAIQALTASITALAAAIAAIKPSPDEAPQVSELGALKTQVDGLTTQLGGTPPPVA